MKKQKPKTTKPGFVEKIIESPVPHEPEKAEIAIEGADPLYRRDSNREHPGRRRGRQGQTQRGVRVGVTVDADAEDTVPQNSSKRN